ncbi:MAG: hypothetical protein RSC34_04160, partial [Alistipes sp.]
MKIKMPLFIFLLMFISCNDNAGKDDKDVIQVEAKALRAWPGTTSTLSIISDGIFSVTSLDPAVA